MRFITLVLCFSLFGINFDKKIEKPENIKAEYEPYSIYVKNEKDKAPLEKDKCMNGAYIYEENIYSDIRSFEEKTGVSNDIYISYVRQGENFPIGEVVECYAKGKIPMIIIDGSFGSSQIMSVAKMCGNLDISMFVEIKSESKFVYEHFAGLFRNYAPKTVLVYGIDSDRTGYEFPEESLVDWVAVDAEENMKGGNIVSEYENISKWCNYFKDKSLMINISVANFSIEKCNYVYSEAANEISRLYSLALNYNNIGAVNYISHIDRYENTISCNYRITEDENIVSAYRNGVNSLVSDRYWSKTPYIAYVSNDKAIVSNNTVKCLNIKGNHINSGYSEINVGGFNKSERKVFVNS